MPGQSGHALPDKYRPIWPETEVPRGPRFGRFQVESGHNSDTVEVKRLTQAV
jgi:hypothetical protein